MTGRGRLEGRVAIVTGASAGIGEATARALAGAGVRVAVCARRRDRLERLAAGLAGRDIAVYEVYPFWPSKLLAIASVMAPRLVDLGMRRMLR